MPEMTLFQSVAVTVVGRGYLSSDHLSTATGLDPAITISKNGGNFANPAAGASVMTEIESTGWYKFALGTGDTDTVGALIIRGTHATMDNIEVVYQVVAAGVTLADDAITAAKFDESTAYPVKSADTGATQIARVGADSDTLETLSDQLDLQATAAELAKVPKSDSNVTWNATALASINAEVDTALNTAIPGSPTADSINQRIAAIDDLTQASGAGDLAAILTDTGTTLDTLIKDVPTVAEFEARTLVAASYFDPAADTVATVTTVTTVSGLANGAITAAAIATGAIDADAIADGAIDAGAFAAGAITATVIADAAIDAATFAAGAITATVIADGAIDAATFAAGAINAAAIATDAIDADAIKTDAVAEIADAVWDEVLDTAHEVAGSASVLLQAAGGAADPWATAVPGAYSAGTAGYIIGTTIPAILADTGTDGVVLASGSITAAVIAQDAIDADALKTDAINEIVDQVWNETISDHAGVGSTGAALAAAGGSGDPWSTAVPGAYGAGTAGYILGTTVPAILADTGTDGVVLANDAITAAKYDESTAFPVKSADTGSTAIARVGADSDTLETLSDQMDGISSQISGIGSGTGAALNFAPDDDNVDGALKSVTFVGTQTSGTYASVAAEDGTYHQITHATNAIDIVYQFSVGGGRSAAVVVWKGYLTGANDTITVQAYNGSTWDTRRVITGTALTSNITYDIPLLATHTGTGADAGKVFIRLVCTGMTAPVLFTDSLIVQAQNLGQTIGYADGSIWVDTVNGSNTGTTPFVDGTADNPVSTWAAALTLAAAVGIYSFRFLPGSSIQLTASAANYRFVGDATIDLNGQSIANALFRDCYTISGVSSGDDWFMYNCGIGSATLLHGYAVGCRLKGTITLTASNEYFLIDCTDTTGGALNNATIVYAASAEVVMRGWKGAISLNGHASTNNTIIDGAGRVIIDTPSGAAGTITMRGFFPVATGAATFGGTLTDDQIYSESVLVDSTWDEATSGHAVSGSVGKAITDILEDTNSTLDDLVDGLETELAKVPKSDSTVTWNATALASINAEVDTALNTAIPGSPTANSINERVAAIDDLTQAGGGGDLAAILLDTGTTLDDLVDGVESELAKVPKSDSTVTWNATALASINSEVVDALNVDTYAEPGQGAPAATASLAAKINYLYKSWRNKKTQTATTRSIYNDAGDTVDQKATDSDDATTFTKGEIGTGA